MVFVTQIPCGSYQANAYLLYAENRSDALIIDPGDDLAALTKAIDQSGRRLSDILLTHGHFDHMLSAAALREKYGARVHVHPSDAYMLTDAGASPAGRAVAGPRDDPVGLGRRAGGSPPCGAGPQQR